MSFQAYLDNVKAKTGKTPDDFKKLAKEKGLTKHGELVAWLKKDFELGHGHANAITHVILEEGQPKVTTDEQIDKFFTGGKAVWRKPYDQLIEALRGFGSEVEIASTKTYVNLLRKGKKFGIVQVSTDRMDVGVKLKGEAATGRLEESGNWNAMVTHRVRVDHPAKLDAELISWLRRAYENA
jgi:hypothetical protein